MHIKPFAAVINNLEHDHFDIYDSLDIQSMHHNSTKVFILEVMGRNAGWLAAAASLAHSQYNEAPHIILFPEVEFNKQEFLHKVQETVKTKGFCVIVASEGINYKEQQLFKEKDAFGHPQLGGIAPFLANAITETLNYKTHWSVADYLQRSARHIASLTDMNQALALGREAINYAARKQNGIMLTINRTNTAPYQWQISSTALENIANCERKLPKNFISQDGWQATKECKEYLRPLIHGEAIPPFKNGIPDYTAPTIHLLTKKLTTIKA
jgi:6-phosphofructokinase